MRLSIIEIRKSSLQLFFLVAYKFRITGLGMGNKIYTKLYYFLKVFLKKVSRRQNKN